EISSATMMPADSSRLIFSAAVSALPSTIVPAWPKLIPGISSMKRPAMKATIGRRSARSAPTGRFAPSFSLSQVASCASIRPPGPTGDDPDQLPPRLDRLDQGVAGEGGGHRDHRPVGHLPDLVDELRHRVEDRHAVDIAAATTGRDPADDVRAVVEVLARQVD